MDGDTLSGDLCLSDDEVMYVRARIAGDKSGIAPFGHLVRVYAPPARMVIVGAVHIAQALAPMAQTAGFAVTDFVADLAALVDAESPDAPVDVIGNSFGGLVALAFAHAHPARVASLVLIDAHDGTAGWAAQMAATLGLRGEARDAKIAASFQAWLGRHSERKRTRLADHARALVEGTTLVADLEASPPLALTQLATIAAPALLLYGEHSDVRDRGAALAAALPRATLEIVAGCTHSILWEATALVRDRVVAWLEAR